MPEAEDDPDHVELTVRKMAELHAEHRSSASALQRRVEGFTSTIGDPRAAPIAIAVVLLWIALNTLGPRLGVKVFDAPPFALLELVATVAAFFTTMMILATQRREEAAARHRAQLTLQLASLSEQKIAKVIALLEEQRQENPQLSSREDPQATEMARPVDPKHVLDRIKDTHDDA